MAKTAKCKNCGQKKPSEEIITYNVKKKICIVCDEWLKKSVKEKRVDIDDTLRSYPKPPEFNRTHPEISKIIKQRGSYECK